MVARYERLRQKRRDYQELLRWPQFRGGTRGDISESLSSCLCTGAHREKDAVNLEREQSYKKRGIQRAYIDAARNYHCAGICNVYLGVLGYGLDWITIARRNYRKALEFTDKKEDILGYAETLKSVRLSSRHIRAIIHEITRRRLRRKFLEYFWTGFMND